ncbi:unnamed protein product, partial [Medioppia subpectinata]
MNINLIATNASKRWPNHDISTLKLLQLVHRHAERPPLYFPPNDPYKDSKYWHEGGGELALKGKYRMYKLGEFIRQDKYWHEGGGELALKGKYRMYKLGEFIRQEYNDYLGDKYSPREVFDRSSVTDRCIESTSSLLAGAYPPKTQDWIWDIGGDANTSSLLAGAYPPKTQDWIWDIGGDAKLAHSWQPIPIQTFIPHENDLVCNEDKHCPLVDRERAKIFERPELKNFTESQKEVYKKASEASGQSIKSIQSASDLWDVLQIEFARNYFWNKTWTQEEEKKMIDDLYLSREMQFRYNWDSPAIRRLRGGGLASQLIHNNREEVANQNNRKLYVYSTHDTTVAAVINALNLSNRDMPPFGATLLFELHQNSKTNEYFVRTFYQNETTINEGIPHALSWGDCQSLTDCPFDKYIESTKHLLYTDFDKEFVNICLILSVNLFAANASKRWPNHDISTLKLLQLVHRHAERPPLNFPPNDPYKDSKYWHEGGGELALKGKY